MPTAGEPPNDAIVLPLPGGRFHALAFGDPAAPPLLWLHGFPDHPPTARALLATLARDRRVIAPWLRGYAPSPVAGPYDLATLAADVADLAHAIAPGRAVDLVGHDWGAAIAYAVASLHPARVRRVVALAVPHPLTLVAALARPAQARRSWYMGLFQLPGAAAIARARDLALIDRLWRTWSPGFVLPAADRAALHACLRASDQLRAPLGYYRALVRPLRGLPARLRRLAVPVAAPVLQLHGADDGCILPPMEADAHRFAGGRTLELLSGVGHFLHLEAPDRVAARVASWLA